MRSFLSSSIRVIPCREKGAPTVWISNRQPLQGETVAIRVSVPPPRTPVGHLRNFFQCRVGGGLVHMRIEEEGGEVHAGKVKTIPVFKDGSDR
jgi:hypothetical protein